MGHILPWTLSLILLLLMVCPVCHPHHPPQPHLRVQASFSLNDSVLVLPLLEVLPNLQSGDRASCCWAPSPLSTSAVGAVDSSYGLASVCVCVCLCVCVCVVTSRVCVCVCVVTSHTKPRIFYIKDFG